MAVHNAVAMVDGPDGNFRRRIIWVDDDLAGSLGLTIDRSDVGSGCQAEIAVPRSASNDDVVVLAFEDGLDVRSRCLNIMEDNVLGESRTRKK